MIVVVSTKFIFKIDSAYRVVIFLFFGHNYDFFPVLVIKMVRIPQNLMLFHFLSQNNVMFPLITKNENKPNIDI